MRMLTLAVVAWGFLLNASCIASPAGEGGVSGGGGHLLYPIDAKEPLPRHEVHRAISAMHGRVVHLLLAKESAYRQGRLSPAEREIFDQLFRQPKSVVGISQLAEVEIESERPCYDAFAKPVDASIHSGEAGSVCVSSFTIARKVDPKNLAAESGALLVHEFSELAGFDEDQAVRLQALVFAEYKQSHEAPVPMIHADFRP